MWGLEGSVEAARATTRLDYTHDTVRGSRRGVTFPVIYTVTNREARYCMR